MSKKKKWLFTLGKTLLLGLGLLWTVVPIYIVVSNSFRKTLEMKQMPPKLFLSCFYTCFYSFSKYFYAG